jgi:hypothetical protein
MKIGAVAGGLVSGLAIACGGGDGGGPTGAPVPLGTMGEIPTPVPSPRAAMPVFQPEWSVSIVPRGEQVAVVISDGASDETIMTLWQQRADFEPWEVAFEADLDGDGIDEAVVSHYTGGAHCCLEYYVFGSLRQGVGRIDWFALGNSAIEDVIDLDGDGIAEITAYDDRLAYFADVPYAGSPSLPLVLCRTGDGTYADCTPDFPARLEDAARQFETSLGDAVAQGATAEELHGITVGLMAMHMRLGTEDDGWLVVRAVCAECEEWLRSNLGELAERLGTEIPYRDEWPQY